ncbi:MAG: GNAT family N-acetyltransferase, partial [Actinomyces sp.]
VNGLCTHERDLSDEMYEAPTMHDPDGSWQMILGVATAPAAQGQGLATRLLRTVIETTRVHGRQGLVLTCLDDLVGFYARLGFVDEGLSASHHGGVPWRQMRLTLV